MVGCLTLAKEPPCLPRAPPALLGGPRSSYLGRGLSPSTVILAGASTRPTEFSATQTYSPWSYTSASWMRRCWPPLETVTLRPPVTSRLLFHQVMVG